LAVAHVASVAQQCWGPYLCDLLGLHGPEIATTPAFQPHLRRKAKGPDQAKAFLLVFLAGYF